MNHHTTNETDVQSEESASAVTQRKAMQPKHTPSSGPKRYDFEDYAKPTEGGHYVTFSDYEKLRKQRDELLKLLPIHDVIKDSRSLTPDELEALDSFVWSELESKDSAIAAAEKEGE